MKFNIIYLDGQFIKVEDSLLMSLAPGRIAGKGVFETMRVEEESALTLDDHLKRLLSGLKSYKIKSPCSVQEIKNNVRKVLKLSKTGHGRIRIVVWQDKNTKHICIAAKNAKPFSKSKYLSGFSACMAKAKRDRTVFSNTKSINYAIFLNEYERARSKGFDEALFKNKFGYLVEGSRTNIFIVKGRKLYSPSIGDGCLNGITRQRTFKLAAKTGLIVKSKSIQLKDLLSADEAFVTNAFVEIMPLTRVEGKKINHARVGKITQQLTQSYKDTIRRSLAFL